MKERIFKVMKWTGLNLSQFADAIQVSPALLSSVKSERTKPTLLLVENIKKVYPDIDINWLITGEGTMFASSKEKAPTPNVEKREVVNVAIDDTAKAKPEVDVPVENTAPFSTREVVAVEERTEKPTEPVQQEDKTARNEKQQVRTVKQVLLMYNDGTYESFEKK